MTVKWKHCFAPRSANHSTFWAVVNDVIHYSITTAISRIVTEFCRRCGVQAVINPCSGGWAMATTLPDSLLIIWRLCDWRGHAATTTWWSAAQSPPITAYQLTRPTMTSILPTSSQDTPPKIQHMSSTYFEC